MSANQRKYEDYLHLFPDKEGKALKKALESGDEDDNAALTAVRHLNREKKRNRGSPEIDLTA